MAISYISSAAQAGSSLTSMPSHQAGDLLIGFGFRDGVATAPSTPSGWTSLMLNTGSSCAARIAYKWATSSSETSGTWTNATGVVVNVYRGVSMIGARAMGNGSSSSISYPALTLQTTGSTSWGVRFAGHRSATNLTTNAPSTVPNTARAGVASEVRSLDSNGTLSANITAGTQSVNQNSGWVAGTVELRGDTGIAASALTDDFSGGSSTPDENKWVSGGSTGDGAIVVDTANQRLQYTGTQSNSQAVLQAVDFINLTEDAVWQGPVHISNAATGLVQNEFQIFTEASNFSYGWRFLPLDGEVEAFKDFSTVLATRTHTNGDWYRIRETGGTVYYDYSTDGTNWTNLTSTVRSSPVLRTTLFIMSPFASGAGALTVTTDNFNIEPESGSDPGAFFAFF